MTRTTTVLDVVLCSAASDTLIQLAAPTPAEVDVDKRQVTGLVVEYGKSARAHRGGRLQFSKGTITLPEDLSRVKLSHYHRGHQKHAFVGHAIAAEERDDGMYMTFQLGSSPEADTALSEVAEKVNDGFSVELGKVKRNGYQVQASALEAVALVGVPAFANARAVLAESELDSQPTTPPAGPAKAPEGITPGSTTTETRPQVELETVIDAIYRLTTEGQTPDVMAALADIHPGNNPFMESPEWLGKVWDGVAYRRRFVPLLDTSRPLTSRLHTGWRFTQKPEVDDWDGNKTEIPTNEIMTEQVTYEAKRIAGGHDLDRIYEDFNEREVIAEYWAAMAESYARKSDLKAVEMIVTTAGTAVIDSGATDLLKAAAIAAEMVGDAVTGDDGNTMVADYIMVNPADRRALLEYGQFDVPAFLALWNIDPRRFVAHSLVPAGTVIAGAKRSIVFREPRGVPIRVNTVNVPLGGHDKGLYGYYATFDPFPTGVVAVQIGA